MTLQEFIALSVDEKSEQLFAPVSKSSFVDERMISGKYIVKIYSLEYFFVEVWANIKENKIEKIIALNNEEDWQGYLNSIKLENLI